MNPPVRKWTRWSKLRAWGRSRLIRTSYLWMVLVPVLARLLQPIAGDHRITALGKSWELHIGLPFTWMVFYAAAISFAVGQFIYAFSAPALVSDYENVADFVGKHGQTAHWELSRQVRLLDKDIVAEIANWETVSETDQEELRRISGALSETHLYRLLVNLRYEDLIKELLLGEANGVQAAAKIASRAADSGGTNWASTKGNTDPHRHFWLLYQFADASRPASRVWCAGLFTTGFLLFVYVAGEGAVSVLRVAFAGG